MPHYLVPRKSGIHRAACFALYRALLRASRSRVSHESISQNDPHRKTCLQHGLKSPNSLRVTAAFHRNSQLQAPHAIIAQLQRGYDLLAAFRAGTVPIDDVTIGPKTYKRRNPRCYISKKNPISNGVNQASSPSIFSRPLPQSKLSGSGIRKVPLLVNGNGIPFLRIHKPQPVALGLRIAKMILWRQKRWDNIKFLEEYSVPAARMEDKWERILIKEFGSIDELVGADLVENEVYTGEGEVKNDNTHSWHIAPGEQDQRPRKKSRLRMVKFADAVNEALKEERQKLDAWQRKRIDHAKKLIAIVERERELKTEELRQSRALAKAKRVERRKVRREAADRESPQEASESG